MYGLKFEPYSTMIGEKFEIFMSEMPTNVVNCQKSDFPPGRNLKIQIPSQNPFSPGTLKSDSPPDRTLSKILISLQNFGEKWHYVC